MPTVNLGRVRPVYLGEYDATKAYVFYDVVLYERSSYLCISTSGSPVGTLPTDTTKWVMLADNVSFFMRMEPNNP